MFRLLRSALLWACLTCKGFRVRKKFASHHRQRIWLTEEEKARHSQTHHQTVAFVVPRPRTASRLDDSAFSLLSPPSVKPNMHRIPYRASRIAVPPRSSSSPYADAYDMVSKAKGTKLGQGKHGEVWKADASDGLTYAVKLIDLEEQKGALLAEGEERGFSASADLQLKAKELMQRCGDDEECARKWERAASHILKYHYVGRDWSSIPENYHVVMEYVEGEDLEKVGGSLTQAQRLSVLEQIIEVIDLMSTTELGLERAWIHRDIKPANTIIKINTDDSVDVKLIDLGLMVSMTSAKRNEYRGMDWPWIPPEARGSKAQFAICPDGSPDGSVSSFDMYSLGVLILETKCGLESEDEEYDGCNLDFFESKIGQIVERLLVQDPCQRPSPRAFLEVINGLKGSPLSDSSVLY